MISPKRNVASAPTKASAILNAISRCLWRIIRLYDIPDSFKLMTYIFSPLRSLVIMSKYPSYERSCRTESIFGISYFLFGGRRQSMSTGDTRQPSVPSHRSYTARIISFSLLDSISHEREDERYKHTAENTPEERRNEHGVYLEAFRLFR